MAERGNRSVFLIIFVVLGLIFMSFLLFLYLTVQSVKSGMGIGTYDSITGDEKASLAVVEVSGPIMSSEEIVKKLHKAEENEKFKAIIVRVDSPGGAVGPTQEIYEEIVRIDANKPVYASFATVAASGGYYIGAAARRIYSNPGTLTGSIGVIMHFNDLSKLYDTVKIHPYIIKSGDYKDTGSPIKKMSEQEQRLLQEMMDGVHNQFRNDILKRRKNKIKGDFVQLTQGQIYSGEQAMKLGLVDKNLGLWEAGREIHQELKIKGKFGLEFVKTQKRFSILDYVENIEQKVKSISSRLGPFVPMFLYELN